MMIIIFGDKKMHEKLESDGVKISKNAGKSRSISEQRSQKVRAIFAFCRLTQTRRG
jgi:hypothetical protein